MDREQLLALVSLYNTNTVIWQHIKGQGWRQAYPSPAWFQAMTDPELQAEVEEHRGSQQRIAESLREALPDAFSEAQYQQITTCDACRVSLTEQDPAYLIWNDARHAWHVYCHRHRPDDYTFHWRATTPQRGA